MRYTREEVVCREDRFPLRCSPVRWLFLPRKRHRLRVTSFIDSPEESKIKNPLSPHLKFNCDKKIKLHANRPGRQLYPQAAQC
jgi:hypothetical protein